MAGFLDGDGSIYVRLKPNQEHRFGFQVSPWIVFYQSSKEAATLRRLQKNWQIGYIRKRNDGILEWTIGDRYSIRALAKELLPYLEFKKRQAELIIEILELHAEVQSASDFLKVAQLIDKFKQLNYSKRRTVNADRVKKHLQERQFWPRRD